MKPNSYPALKFYLYLHIRIDGTKGLKEYIENLADLYDLEEARELIKQRLTALAESKDFPPSFYNFTRQDAIDALYSEDSVAEMLNKAYGRSA